MKMSNKQIYYIAKEIQKLFPNDTEKIPIELLFFINKNKKLFLTLAQEIEESQILIYQTYGYYEQSKQKFIFSQTNAKKANFELKKLLNLEQDVHIIPIPINNIIKSNIQLSLKQAKLLTIMIEEPKEDFVHE